VTDGLRLRGERVLLRPFRPEEFDAVWEARGRMDDLPRRSTWADRRRLRRRLERSGAFAYGWLDLAIEVTGRLAGEIDARRPQRALPPGVFELGIGLYEPTDRGRGIGSEAVQLLTAHLFAELEAERVQASTAVGNRAMRRVFEKLGYLEEGVMRSFMPGVTERDDYVLYAITRKDWMRNSIQK
jgi:RimJ/RimL family protein N-acetyltransferase